MFRAIAALALASTTAQSPSTLDSSASWWERVTVTVAGDGETHSCRYESSLQPNGAQACDVDGSPAALASESGAKAQYTRITFERRFSPGAKLELNDLEPGETFLGGQVMSLAIDSAGAVQGCKIVARSGSMRPGYSCEDAAAERFQASAAKPQAGPREGFMTILVYGHSEHIV